MREQLIQYVNLLFAGAEGCEEIRQEILQNTLDRYDDLVAEGKAPEAAYRLAIVGIGDINEILGASAPSPRYSAPQTAPAKESQDNPTKKLLRAVAVFLYILSPVPLFLLTELHMETVGLCGTLAIIAAATALIMLGGKKSTVKEEKAQDENDPRSELHRSIKKLISVIGLVVYFLLSFATGAWFITWLIFPIIGAVQGLVKAILDLKEAIDNEN